MDPFRKVRKERAEAADDARRKQEADEKQKAKAAEVRAARGKAARAKGRGRVHAQLGAVLARLDRDRA